MEKNFIKKAIKRVIKGVALATLVVTCFASCSQLDAKKQQSNNKEDSSISITETEKENFDALNLPEDNEAKAKLQEIFGNNYQDYLARGENLVRLPCPKEGEAIKVNVGFDVNDTQKEIIEECLAEYNQVFAVINPNYRFVANYNPTEEDLSNPSYIDVQKINKFEGNDKGIGHASFDIENASDNIDGYESYNNVITLTEACLNAPQALMGTFKHEFLHTLGRAYAYNNDQVDKDTIMDGGEKLGTSIYPSHSSLQELDVAFIDACYRSPDNQNSDAYIQYFIDRYEKTNQYTFEKYQQSKDFESYRQVISEIDIDDLIKDIENSEYDDSVKQKIIETLNGTNKISKEFGSVSGAIGECLKSDDTYTYMMWDEDDNLSIDKRSSKVGSSSQRSMVENRGLVRIGDTYSGQLLFNVGDYVLSFDYKKDYFSNELSLSEDFSKLYEITQLTREEYFQKMVEMNQEQSSAHE